MKFDLNQFLEKYGIKNTVLILMISFIIFTIIPNDFINYIKKNTILKLDDKYKEALSFFYDSDIKKYNKIVELENKYIDYLTEIGIVEHIIPIVLTRNSKNEYRVSDEYREILNKLSNKNKI